MGEVTRVDIPAVKALANDILQSGLDLQGFYDVAMAEVERNWGSWGNDQYGRQFAKDWAPQTEELMDGFIDLIAAFKDVGEGLKELTVAFSEIDVSAGESLTYMDQ